MLQNALAHLGKKQKQRTDWTLARCPRHTLPNCKVALHTDNTILGLWLCCTTTNTNVTASSG